MKIVATPFSLRVRLGDRNLRPSADDLNGRAQTSLNLWGSMPTSTCSQCVLAKLAELLVFAPNEPLVMREFASWHQVQGPCGGSPSWEAAAAWVGTVEVSVKQKLLRKLNVMEFQKREWSCQRTYCKILP